MSTPSNIDAALTVKVSWDFPPVPVRSHDWSAYFDGREEAGPWGHGETHEAALADLYEQLDSEDLERWDRAQVRGTLSIRRVR